MSVQTFAMLLFVIGQASAVDAQAPSAPLPGNAPAAPPATAGPKIQFDSVVYDFKRVMAGDMVKHDFIFTNTGAETLEITSVNPSCGCTTAGEWTHRVEPGRTGVIPLEFNTGRFPGQTVVKTATIICNDRTQPPVILQLKGTIWVPIEIAPPSPVLTIINDEPSNAPMVVSITNNLDEPLTLSAPQVSGGAIAAELKTIQAGKVFQLVLRAATPPPQSSSSAIVSMKTSSTNVPVVNVNVMALVQPSVMVYPTELVLTRNGNNVMPASIVIQNNTATPLTVSEPKFSDAAVSAQLKEIQPGRMFNIVLTFPPGYQVPQNGGAQLTAKTSNPKLPIVRVPVRQLPPAPVSASVPVPVPSLSR